MLFFIPKRIALVLRWLKMKMDIGYMVCSSWIRHPFVRTLNFLIARGVSMIVAMPMFKRYCKEMMRIELHQV